jgi:hypothetical protein
MNHHDSGVIEAGETGSLYSEPRLHSPEKPPQELMDEELCCVQCGERVKDVVCGHRNPCPFCGFPYPVGDCSDLVEN